MSAPARWPDADSLPVATIGHRYDSAPPVYFEDRSEANEPALDAAMEAVLEQCRLDLARTTGLSDGTRSAQVVVWAAEILRDLSERGAA